VCTACLFPSQRKIRLRNRARARERSKQWLAGIPTRVKSPPNSPRRGPNGERLCITPGCDTVLTHRKKKCTKCLERVAADARRLLSRTAGRGRRTDLERQHVA